MADGKGANVTVQYFALLRDQRGAASEQLVTQARTAGELYEELRARHSFTVKTDFLKVALNDEFAPWSAELKDGDKVIFITPVAGG
jgi:molybdopterin converting factor small subunit